jgi:hypothetical protein
MGNDIVYFQNSMKLRENGGNCNVVMNRHYVVKTGRCGVSPQRRRYCFFKERLPTL